ncbi:MAG: LysR family transcriptional regulator [Clostridia bacterium]|nr:LysR family transcriptional regulator [Clostridia bacterium]
MDSTKCEAFLAAIDSGSLTAAGQILGYTQPGITRMINSLEEELGFQLFVRTKKGVIPTPNGSMMLPAFREIVRAHQYALEVSSDIRGTMSGVLTIGSYYSVAAVLLPTIITNFQHMFPNVRINLKEGGNREMTRWLNERSVDCCFCAEPSPGTICDWIPIQEDDLLVWLPSNHPKAHLDAFPIRDIEDEPFIMTMPDQDTDLDRLLSSESLKPDIRFSTADAYTTYCMVSAGLGVSLNNRLVTQNWTGSVVTLPFDPPHSISLGIAVPSLKDTSPATKKFIDCVKSTLNVQD